MSGRVLNFSEFFDKYSKDSTDNKKSLDSFTQSSSNFEVGFDDSTYSQTQIGPNRPVSSETESTPAQPGEEGTSFNAEPDAEMNVPAEEIEEPTEEESTPEPEAGSNPKKEDKKMSESTNLKDFTQFVNEFHGAEYVTDLDWDKENDPFSEDDSDLCSSCGEIIEYSEDTEQVCGCNM